MANEDGRDRDGADAQRNGIVANDLDRAAEIRLGDVPSVVLVRGVRLDSLDISLDGLDFLVELQRCLGGQDGRGNATRDTDPSHDLRRKFLHSE